MTSPPALSEADVVSECFAYLCLYEWWVSRAACLDELFEGGCGGRNVSLILRGGLDKAVLAPLGLVEFAGRVGANP